MLEDNEPNAFESGYDFETTVIFDVDSDFRFHLVGLDPVMEIDSKIKSIIDEGLESPMYDDLRSLFALTDLSIVRFEALYTLNPENALGGYVYNRSTDTDAWVLGLNLFYAYHRVTVHGSEPMHYNQDGTYGYILAHEFGHLLTLNFAHEVDPYSTHENCSELLLQEGCFKQQSILNSFNNTFYINSESPLKDPTHVTPYAQTNIAEDIAETFAYYIHQDPIPELYPTSSGALHKIHFSAEQSLLMQLKPQMRHHLDIRQLPHIANPIYSKTLRPFGELNSCLEVKRKRN